MLFTWERILRGTITPHYAACWVLIWWVTLRASGNFGCANALCFSLLILAAYVDSVCRILPDPLLLLAVCVLCVRGISFQQLVCASFSYVFGFLICEYTSLGRGDVKLLSVIALLFQEYAAIASVCLVAALGAGLFVVALMLVHRVQRTTSIPLGPWIVGAALIIWVAKASIFLQAQTGELMSVTQ